VNKTNMIGQNVKNRDTAVKNKQICQQRRTQSNIDKTHQQKRETWIQKHNNTMTGCTSTEPRDTFRKGITIIKIPSEFLSLSCIFINLKSSILYISTYMSLLIICIFYLFILHNFMSIDYVVSSVVYEKTTNLFGTVLFYKTIHQLVS
jgi:hypothetical protein